MLVYKLELIVCTMIMNYLLKNIQMKKFLSFNSLTIFFSFSLIFSPFISIQTNPVMVNPVKASSSNNTPIASTATETLEQRLARIKREIEALRQQKAGLKGLIDSEKGKQGSYNNEIRLLARER